LQKISKAEYEWLVDNGYLRLRDGKYSELSITNRQHAKKKTRFVTDELAKIVREKNIV
jgi:hypothetical protein